MSDLYAARFRCGCILSICVINPDRAADNAKFCSKSIRDGATIEKITHKQFQTDKSILECAHPESPECANKPKPRQRKLKLPESAP